MKTCPELWVGSHDGAFCLLLPHCAGPGYYQGARGQGHPVHPCVSGGLATMQSACHEHVKSNANAVECSSDGRAWHASWHVRRTGQAHDLYPSSEDLFVLQFLYR